MARQILEASKKFSKKDFINSRNGSALQDLESGKITISACAIIEDVDDEERKEIGTLITDAGVFTTISDNIIDSIRDLIDIEDELDQKTVEIKKRKSKQGRDFLSMTIL